MRMLKWGLVAVWAFLLAFPLNSAPTQDRGKRDQEPAEEPEPETAAYYVVKQDDEEIGIASLELGDRQQTIFRTELPIEAVRQLDPAPVSGDLYKKQTEVSIDISRRCRTDADGNLIEIELSVNSALGRQNYRGTYLDGSWTMVVTDSGESKRKPNIVADPCLPKLPEIFLSLARRKALKKGATIKEQVLWSEENAELAELTCEIVDTETRTGHDGEDHEYFKVEVMVKTVDGQLSGPVKAYVDADGWVDEMTVGNITFQRVEDKDALGARFEQKGRRDVFERSLATPPTSEAGSDGPVGPNPVAPTQIDIALVDLEKKIQELRRVQDPVEMRELGGAIKRRIDALRAAPKLTAKQQGDIKVLEDDLLRVIPRQCIMDLWEAQALAVEILQLMAREKAGVVEEAEEKLVQIDLILQRDTLKACPNEEEMVREIQHESKIVIGKKVLLGYLTDIEVTGVVYRRSEVMEKVSVELSLMGLPLLVSEEIPVLHPRGLCILNETTYREGEYLTIEDAKFPIRIKEVFDETVVLEGHGAVVELRLRSQSQKGK